MWLLGLLLGLDSDSGDLRVGDWVEILTYGEEGEIIEIHGSEYYEEIDDGSGRVDTFKGHELRKIW